MTSTATATVADPPKRVRGWRRRVLFGVLALLLVFVAYIVGTFVQVWQASGRDRARPADAIVVLGAAQYNGKPSPALQLRLDHALALYHRGLADVVVVTGGKQTGDRYTEATVGYNVLRRSGVPDSAIRKEVQGRTTYESLASVSRFLHAEGREDVILISGPATSKRLSGIASAVGLHAAISPADGAPTVRSLIRETIAVSFGRLVGYRRMERVEH
ncbi:MAG: YdcF family protein [Acidimicrobiales bacterium]|nr:YdcF family protein [Acidimicrobiales bacterium]